MLSVNPACRCKAYCEQASLRSSVLCVEKILKYPIAIGFEMHPILIG
jgi:hypothetical protein